MAANLSEYEVPFQDTVLVGSRWTPLAAKRTALLLHGGGTSSAAGFLALRTFLAAEGIETHTFDFIGHGRTGGTQLGTTLQGRVQQVRAVVESQELDPSTLTMVGFSMGAYVAAKAAIELDVARLCLAVPAAYAAQVYEVPFGPAFTHMLRTPRSWQGSDAFELVRNYTGHLLVISAEQDQVVPAEIPHTYALSSDKRASTVHHIVKGSGHKLNEHLKRDPNVRITAYDEIASLCRRGDT